jgi:peptidoglycan/LPS O-acetylase OafA/YrhL
MKNLPSSSFSSNNTEHLAFLDGLRAIAALWVVLGHCHLFSLGWSRSATLWGRPLDLLLYMHLGVNIFLVLSGFCLALPVVRNGNRLRMSIVDYFLARAWRILPPYLVTLILILLVNCFVPLATWGRHPVGLTDEIPTGVLLSNIFLLQDIFPSMNVINGPFWSIAVEWHLYFVFPFLILFLRRGGTFVLFAAGVIIALALSWMNAAYPQLSASVPVTVPNPPYYIFLFVMGILAASLAFDPRVERIRASLHRWAWIAALILCIPLCAILWKYRIIDATNLNGFFDHLHIIDPLTGAITAAFLLGMCGLRPANRVRRLFEARPLVVIGGFSYSLYLIHVPILAALNRGVDLAGLTGRSPSSAFFVMVVVGVGVSLLCARQFARVFERRYRPASSQPDHKAVLVRENV